MKLKPLIAILLPTMLQVGCMYKEYTRTRSEVIAPKITEAGTFSTLDVDYVGVHSASIGDPLFRVNRYIYGKGDKVQFRAPTSVPFPSDRMWRATHIFNDGKTGDLNVYTNPNYYNGAIGVILESNGDVATDKPVVQLKGSKSGRRWPLSGTGRFFDSEPVLIDWWTLRYGGTSEGNYIFEIVKAAESSSSEILQSIEITRESFLEGFTIRGVFVRGAREDLHGVIEYEVKDTFTSDPKEIP